MIGCVYSIARPVRKLLGCTNPNIYQGRKSRRTETKTTNRGYVTRSYRIQQTRLIQAVSMVTIPLFHVKQYDEFSMVFDHQQMCLADAKHAFNHKITVLRPFSQSVTFYIQLMQVLCMQFSQNLAIYMYNQYKINIGKKLLGLKLYLQVGTVFWRERHSRQQMAAQVPVQFAWTSMRQRL